MIGLSDAQAQAVALRDAAEASTVRQLRYELSRRCKEWERACTLIEDADPAAERAEVAIELAGSVSPGMKVPTHAGWGSVVRQMNRDGQLSLHIEDAEGRPLYLNFVGPSSPCVVRA